MAKDPTQGPVTKYDEHGRPYFVNDTDSAVIGDQVSASQGTYSGESVPVVIWAGGRGTRLMDKTFGKIPKPMITVGGLPLLEHIMRIYSAQGFRDFIIAAGHLREKIENWVHDCAGLQSFADSVRVIDTGEQTQTGGRILRLKPHISTPFFMATYGDGVADINLLALINHFQSLSQPGRSGATAVLSAARPPARFGSVEIQDGRAVSFGEKPQSSGGWINAGFYIMRQKVFDLIPGDGCKLEYDVLPALAAQGKLGAYQHPNFFQMCDTWRDHRRLERLWERGDAPWKRWE